MIQPNITIAGKTVISSGSFICRLEDEVNIFPFATEYKISLRFVPAEEGIPFFRLYSDPDPKTMILEVKDEITSFIGNVNPLHVANRNNIKVMMWFAVESFGKGKERKKLFSFTCYEDGAAK